MAVSKSKITRKKRGQKTACNQKLSTPSLTICKQCNVSKENHRICVNCGYYRGRQVLKLGKNA